MLTKKRLRNKEQRLAIVTQFIILGCVHTMPTNFGNGENVVDRPPVQTKTAQFLPADFENGRF